MIDNNNPYQAPNSSTTQRTKGDFPAEEWRQMVLAGQTTAGPAAIWMCKHPKMSRALSIIGSLIVVGAVAGLF